MKATKTITITLTPKEQEDLGFALEASRGMVEESARRYPAEVRWANEAARLKRLFTKFAAALR